jgi:hypothetical protein
VQRRRLVEHLRVLVQHADRHGGGERGGSGRANRSERQRERTGDASAGSVSWPFVDWAGLFSAVLDGPGSLGLALGLSVCGSLLYCHMLTGAQVPCNYFTVP